VQRHPTQRVAGTAVFLVSDPDGTPTALLHNIKHNRVLHAQNVILTVLTEEVPHVPPTERLRSEVLGPDFLRITLRYGFMQDPDVMTALAGVDKRTLGFDPQQATYFLSRNTLLTTGRSGMALWRERLFVLLARNAIRPSQFFQLPPNRIVELGMRVEL
jgi:KUP system potassium uptake protein